MNKIKEILRLIDSKYKACFNKFISIPKVNEILKKLKIPTEKILAEEKFNKIARYGTVSFIVLVCYLMVSSGDSTYRGNELKKYTVSAENILKHIKSLGLKNPNFSVSDIRTKKLTKKMVDNGVSSYQLIEDTIKEYINENIESLIDVNKSIYDAFEYEYKHKLYRDFYYIGKYASTGKVNKDEFINEKIFIETAKKDNPIKVEDVIQDIKQNGFRHKSGSELGTVKIDLTKYSSYVKWLDALKNDIENKINKKAKENILNKINEDLLGTLEGVVSADFSKGKNGNELFKLASIDDLKKEFGESKKYKKIFEYILSKNNIKYFDASIAKRNIGKRYVKEEVKSKGNGILTIEEILKNTNNPDCAKIQNIIADKDIALGEFYNKLAEIDLNKIEKKMPGKPIENLFAFVRDYNILDNEYKTDIAKTKKILEGVDKKEIFRKYVLSNSWLQKNTLSDSEIEVIGNDIFKKELEKLADKFYNDGLEIYVYEHIVRPYAYAILKMKQISTGIKDEITFEDEFNLIKNRLPENLKSKAEKIFNQMPSETRKEILSNEIALTYSDSTSYSDQPTLFDSLVPQYIAPGGGYESDDEFQDPIKKDKFRLNPDPIQASRELSCFKILDKTEILIRENEKKNAEIAKENARKKAEQDAKDFNAMITDKSNVIITELLSISKQLTGSNFELNITSIRKIEKSKTFKFSIPVSEIDPTSSNKIIFWNANTLLQEKQNPNKRTGEVLSEIPSSITGNDKNYEVEFSVIFAGEILYRGSIDLMYIDKNRFIPFSISFNRGTLTFIDENRETYYNFNVFKKTSYYNSCVKSYFVELAKNKYEKAKDNGLVKRFPDNVRFKEIDESYDSSFLIKILQQSVSKAFNSAIPKPKHSSNDISSGMLGALSTALDAQNGKAFDMKKFANALPFDSKTKNEIASDAELSSFFNQIAYKQAAQVMVRSQAQLERERKVQTAYEQRVSREGEKLALSMYDTSDEVSAGMLYVIHKAISYILKDEKIAESDISKVFSFTGRIIPSERMSESGKKYVVQKISLSEKAPNIAKRIFNNLEVDSMYMPTSYYNIPIAVDFDATFCVKKSKDILLPELLLK